MNHANRASHQAFLLSELLPHYLDYLRVEKNRRPLTLERYETYLGTFIRAVGDGPVRAISSEHILRYKRHMLDAGLTKWVYPHMLRHTLATTLLVNGCPIGHIQASSRSGGVTRW